jgi:hypothetical protein
LNGTIDLLLPLDVQRTGEEEAIMFPCNATISISLCPHLSKNTRHNPYPHSLAIMMKKREGMPHPAAAGVGGCAEATPRHPALHLDETGQGGLSLFLLIVARPRTAYVGDFYLFFAIFGFFKNLSKRWVKFR